MCLPHGDRWYTFADSSAAQKDLDFNPDTPITEGIQVFVDWYVNEYVPAMNDLQRDKNKSTALWLNEPTLFGASSQYQIQ